MKVQFWLTVRNEGKLAEEWKQQVAALCVFFFHHRCSTDPVPMQLLAWLPLQPCACQTNSGIASASAQVQPGSFNAEFCTVCGCVDLASEVNAVNLHCRQNTQLGFSPKRTMSSTPTNWSTSATQYRINCLRPWISLNTKIDRMLATTIGPTASSV